MTAYYNEIDPFAAAWLCELIKVGAIAPGVVDTRDIRDVRPSDLRGFTQHHFFAGIGVWSYALRRAGWPDSRPVSTGSCPCQPFSAAGKGLGFDDERHLWPSWFWLISQCGFGEVLGEQVASRDGLAWLDLVQTDMEGTNYAFAPIDLCAAGVGAPHPRARLWFGAKRGWQQWRSEPSEWIVERGLGAGGMADTDGGKSGQRRDAGSTQSAGFQSGIITDGRGGTGGMADAERGQFPQPEWGSQGRNGDGPDRADHNGGTGRPGPVNGFWRDADWLFCRDGKWRPVEPGTFPLAHGVTARMGRLRGYGNAINAEAATAFIKAYMSATA